MKFETAKTLVGLANDRGYEFSLHENYSGRGMFGESTTAICVDNLADFSLLLFEAAEDIADEQRNGSLPYSLGGLSTDNLGRDYVIY